MVYAMENMKLSSPSSSQVARQMEDDVGTKEQANKVHIKAVMKGNKYILSSKMVIVEIYAPV